MDIGKQLVGEFSGSPRTFRSLPDTEQRRLREMVGKQNWFRIWLRQMAEGFEREIGTVKTKKGEFEQLLMEM